MIGWKKQLNVNQPFLQTVDNMLKHSHNKRNQNFHDC